MEILFVLAFILFLPLVLGAMRVNEQPGGSFYRAAFHDPVQGVPVRITPADFDGLPAGGGDWLDSEGYLKPGTPLKEDGTLADGLDAAGAVAAESAEFVTMHAVRIAESNASADLTGAPGVDIGAATRGDIVTEHVEEALGRALSAEERSSILDTGRFTLI